MKTKDYLPSSRGFSKYYGYYLGCTDYWKHYGDLGDGGEIAVELHQGGTGLGLAPGHDVPLYNTSGNYSTSLYADIAARWIREHDQTSPMFMYLAFQGAHSANNKFVQAPADILARPEIHAISPDNTCGQWETPQTGNCDKQAMRKTIAATVVAVDEAVAVVEQALADVGMWENTLVIFSTDNGGPTDGTNNNMMNNFPLRSGKGETFEGGIRAAGFVHGAGLADAVKGTVSHQLHHVSDWFKTLLSAAQKDRPPSPSPLPSLKPGERPFLDGDGLDNWAALSQGGASARDEIFIAAQAEGSKLKAHALRRGDGMKLLWHPSLLYDMPGWYPPPGKAWDYANFTVKCPKPPSDTAGRAGGACDSAAAPCLFNLTADPCEHNNVASEHPGIVASMQARIQELKATTVLTWVNFEKSDAASDPSNFGPTTPITPDPQPDEGPHVYQGVWKPWLSSNEDSRLYPSWYTGPGYPQL